MKLFEPVEFELPEKKEEVKKVEKVEFPDYEVFKTIIDKIRQEMTRIEIGTSELRAAMYFPKGNNPADNLLHLFEKDPHEEILDKFFEVVRHDYGTRVYDTFLTWIREVYPSVKGRLSDE